MRNPTLTLTHPEATREGLLSFARKTPGASIGIKVAALLLILEGQRPKWIIDILGLTRQSLNNWMHGVNERGVAALRALPRPGRPTQLTGKIQRALENDLERSPQEFGLNRVGWDGPTLVVHMKRQFGIKLKVRQAQMWMHRLGYRLKHSSYAYLQARSGDARRFAKELKKTQKSGAEGNGGV
jgi:transposase